MSFLFILLGLFGLGAGLALIFIGGPAIARLLWQVLKALYAVFVLLPLQIIRVAQGKPPVEKKES